MDFHAFTFLSRNDGAFGVILSETRRQIGAFYLSPRAPIL